VVVRVVQVDDVDPVEAGALQARLEGAQHAVAAEVPDTAMVGRDREAFRVGQVRRLRRRHEQASDLCGDHVVVAGPRAKGGAQTPLGQAEAVVRCGVEVPESGVPGGVDRGRELLVASGAVHVAALRSAEAERGEEDGGSARHGHRFHRPYRPSQPPSTGMAAPWT
jgi:hypothetical protein